MIIKGVLLKPKFRQWLSDKTDRHFVFLIHCFVLKLLLILKMSIYDTIQYISYTISVN